MNSHAETTAIVGKDHDATNRRLLARKIVAKSDHIESASRKVPVTLYSPEAKRLYLRCFEVTQAHFHFITVFGRMKLPEQDVEKVEQDLRNMLDSRLAHLNQALVALEARCISHGITSLATYDIEPIVIETKVFSMLDRRMLELIEKLDQLMPMLETLCIDEVMTPSQLILEKSEFKLTVRGSARAAHIARATLEHRANILHAESLNSAALAPKSSATTPASETTYEGTVEPSLETPTRVDVS